MCICLKDYTTETLKLEMIFCSQNIGYYSKEENEYKNIANLGREVKLELEKRGIKYANKTREFIIIPKKLESN
jgi:hypothetical protein